MPFCPGFGKPGGTFRKKLMYEFGSGLRLGLGFSIEFKIEGEPPSFLKL